VLKLCNKVKGNNNLPDHNLDFLSKEVSLGGAAQES
jgi:hypothetical protein